MNLKRYKKEELDGLKGTLHIGVDCSENGDSGVEVLFMVGDNGKTYIIYEERFSIQTTLNNQQKG